MVPSGLLFKQGIPDGYSLFLLVILPESASRDQCVRPGITPVILEGIPTSLSSCNTILTGNKQPGPILLPNE